MPKTTKARKPATKKTTKTTAKKTTTRKSATKTSKAVSAEAIAMRAYQIFEERGYTHGNDQQDWLEAETQLLQQQRL